MKTCFYFENTDRKLADLKSHLDNTELFYFSFYENEVVWRLQDFELIGRIESIDRNFQHTSVSDSNHSTASQPDDNGILDPLQPASVKSYEKTPALDSEDMKNLSLYDKNEPGNEKCSPGAPDNNGCGLEDVNESGQKPENT